MINTDYYEQFKKWKAEWYRQQIEFAKLMRSRSDQQTKGESDE